MSSTGRYIAAVRKAPQSRVLSEAITCRIGLHLASSWLCGILASETFTKFHVEEEFALKFCEKAEGKNFQITSSRPLVMDQA